MFESFVPNWWSCLGNIRKLEEVGHRVTLCQKPLIIPRVLSATVLAIYLPACHHQALRYDSVMDKFSSCGSHNLARILPSQSWLDHATNTSNYSPQNQ